MVLHNQIVCTVLLHFRLCAWSC